MWPSSFLFCIKCHLVRWCMDEWCNMIDSMNYCPLIDSVKTCLISLGWSLRELAKIISWQLLKSIGTRKLFVGGDCLLFESCKLLHGPLLLLAGLVPRSYHEDATVGMWVQLSKCRLAEAGNFAPCREHFICGRRSNPIVPLPPGFWRRLWSIPLLILKAIV